MSATFSALSVNKGDAFLYQTNDTTVLVDGGFNPYQATDLLRAKRVNLLDVVVCTHNDKDHAEGIPAVLQSEIRCKEVWLPGRWTSHLSDLFDHPVLVADCVLAQVRCRRDELANVKSLGDYGNSIANDPGDCNRQAETENGDDDRQQTDADLFSDLRVAIEHASGQDNSTGDNDALLALHRQPYLFESVNEASLFLEALAAAFRIRTIAIAAFDAGALIRWFEFDSRAPVGRRLPITPLNSCEVFSTRRSTLNLLAYLALSTANLESLVFCAMPGDDNPGVVFSADSDFSFEGIDRLPQSNYLVTAPHHGSHSNKSAYDRIHPSLSNDAVYVRSDCNSSSRGGESYRKLKYRRYCTLCRNSTKGRQPVELSVQSDVWLANPGTWNCEC